MNPGDWGRLRWRCRRGMKELDLLLTRYLEQRYAAAPAAEQAAFRALLEAPDPEILDLCVGRRRPADAALAALIGALTAVPPGEPAKPVMDG